MYTESDIGLGNRVGVVEIFNNDSDVFGGNGDVFNFDDEDEGC